MKQILQIYILFKEGLHIWKKRLFYTAVDIKKIGFLNSETDSYVVFHKKNCFHIVNLPIYIRYTYILSTICIRAFKKKVEISFACQIHSNCFSVTKVKNFQKQEEVKVKTRIPSGFSRLKNSFSTNMKIVLIVFYLVSSTFSTNLVNNPPCSTGCIKLKCSTTTKAYLNRIYSSSPITITILTLFYESQQHFFVSLSSREKIFFFFT